MPPYFVKIINNTPISVDSLYIEVLGKIIIILDEKR